MKRFGIIVGIMTLGGCGGGGGSTVSGPPGGNPTYSDGRVSDAIVNIVGGKAVPEQITVDGRSTIVLRAFADEDVFSDGTRFYRVATGDDGESFSIIGFTLSGNYVGEYLSSGSLPQTSGTASYNGPYRGQLFGPYSGAADIITGSANVNIDFSRGDFNGRISNRRFFLSSGYNQAQLGADVAFSGTVNRGVLEGTHSDADSAGNVNAVAYSGGVVGTVSVVHSRASTFTSSDIPEFGVFTAD